MAFRIQLRRDTKALWAANNPVLLLAELGYEYDTGKAKMGDGVNPWNDLPYWPGMTGATGSVGPTGPTVSVVGGTGIAVKDEGGTSGTPIYRVWDSSIVNSTSDLTSLSGNYAFRYVYVQSLKSFYILKNGATGSNLSDWVPLLVSGGDAFPTPGETDASNYYG